MYVFAAGELLNLDQDSTVARNGTGEIVAILTEADSYSAFSRISSPGMEQLRAAGSDYPDSIRRYLELPEELPARVLDLALSLTADQPTPYDRAVMLEAYLRQFPYSLEVPGPPPNRDAVDYFLFDLKTGYCDYYASAMVVMARAAGLPSRLVMGYSEGIYAQQEGYFVVRASNAHAWAEIYFPNIGWVEFEPTPSQPLHFRPGQTLDGDQNFSLPAPGQEARLSIHLERTWLGRAILRLLAILFVILFIRFLPLETWWLSLLPADRALATIFHRLYRRGRLFDIRPDPSRTPNEFAGVLSNTMEGLAMSAKQMMSVVVLRADLDYLTSAYDRLLFSGHSFQDQEKKRAIQVWARIRRGLKQFKRRIRAPR
jgi:hypothetical protein